MHLTSVVCSLLHCDHPTHTYNLQYDYFLLFISNSFSLARPRICCWNLYFFVIVSFACEFRCARVRIYNRDNENIRVEKKIRNIKFDVLNFVQNAIYVSTCAATISCIPSRAFSHVTFLLRILCLNFIS